MINEAKKQYFHNKVSTSPNKVKAAWKIIKGNSGNLQTHNMITKINYEGQALTSTNETAKAFNQYYTKIVTNINTGQSDLHKASLLLGNKKIDNITRMKIIPITETEVKEIIRSLKSKNSMGYDGVSNTVLKHCLHFISKPVTHACR